jgi:hypothetical protein
MPNTEMNIYFYGSGCLAMWMLLSVLDKLTAQTIALAFLWPFIWPVYVISALLDNASG